MVWSYEGGLEVIYMRNFWDYVYIIYPPVLRKLEKIKVHNKRQEFLLGFLKKEVSVEEVNTYLSRQGFEKAILAWKDPDEAVSMRKIDLKIYQYHIRVYKDKEVRGHYEYSSEGNPWGHVREKCFEPRQEYFKSLLRDYLKR